VARRQVALNLLASKNVVWAGDVTAPAFSGTVALTAEGETSVKAVWSAGITDGHGVTEGRVYYSTTAPANTTASGVTAWKTAATTYYVDVSPLSSLGAAGSATVPALVEGTTYHVYLCVKDAAGNELNVATTPASVSTTNATAPTGALSGSYPNLANSTDSFSDRSSPTARSLVYSAQTFPAFAANTANPITVFTDTNSPVSSSGDFTIMFPVRLAYDVTATTASLDRLNFEVLNSHVQIQYNHDDQGFGSTKNLFLYSNSPTGTSFVSLPDHTTKWFNNYHVLTVVHKASTSRVTAHIHYYTTDVDNVSSVTTEAGFMSGYSRRQLRMYLQGRVSRPVGSIPIRQAHLFNSALNDAELLAKSKEILK
jgi:hypothetical protein